MWPHFKTRVVLERKEIWSRRDVVLANASVQLLHCAHASRDSLHLLTGKEKGESTFDLMEVILITAARLQTTSDLHTSKA
jgi:hypothetical protein